jgi:hypothetical protein
LRLRPETDDLVGLSGQPDRQLVAAVKTALRDLLELTEVVYIWVL